MEDTLREYYNILNRGIYYVLILVLMEDTLRALIPSCRLISDKVLILVLMEDTLRVTIPGSPNSYVGLNPCFNGRYSQRYLDSNYAENLAES